MQKRMAMLIMIMGMELVLVMLALMTRLVGTMTRTYAAAEAEEISAVFIVANLDNSAA